MPDSTQTAVRVGDDILHSESLGWGIAGIIGGLAAGLVVGVLIVGGTIATGGALAVVVGATLLGGGLGGGLGKILGSHHSAGAKGKVLTGSPNVFIGFDKKPAARAEADVAHCEEHSDSEPALEQPAIIGKKIAQGSEHVLINGHYAARKGDRGTCDFTLGDGWATVVIGGPPKTVAGLTITSETASIDGLITGMMIAGGIVLMIPAAAAMLSAGAAAGVSGAALYGQVALRVAGQFGLGYLMSEGGGKGMHSLGVNVFGLKEGSEALEMMTFGGQVLTPFAGAKGFKAISDAPFVGGKSGGEVPVAEPIVAEPIEPAPSEPIVAEPIEPAPSEPIEPAPVESVEPSSANYPEASRPLPEAAPAADAPKIAERPVDPGEAPAASEPLPANEPEAPLPERAPEASAPDNAPGSEPADAEPPVTKLSQSGGLKATEGTRVTKPNGQLGPASHPLESHGPDRPLSVSDGLDSVEQRMIDKPNMGSSTKFADRAAMETAIGKAVDANTADIDAWLATNPPAGSNMPPIDYDPQMGNIGEGYSRPSAGAPYSPINTPLESIRMILKSDGNGGYVIQTAYPTP